MTLPATMIHNLTLDELITKVRHRELSSKEIVTALIDRINRIDTLINAYVHIDPQKAISEAEEADKNFFDNLDKPLWGIPIALKDIIAHKGSPLTCASKILQGFISPYDAAVVERLKAAGAIILGRLNMDEFAMGSSTENSIYGPTKNPWDLERVAGGSSGGCAAAIAAGECFASIGSDTGGSVRQPAAYCGCVGLKPTYGRVSRYGLVSYASSLDQIGPVTKTVKDAGILLRIIAGHDPRDSTSFPIDVPDYPQLLTGEIKGLRIGVVKEYMGPGLDPEVKTAINNAITQLASLGAEIVEVSIPSTEYAIAAYYIIATAEASANLARYDGVRYGLRVDGADLYDMYTKTRGTGFGKEVKRRIILGTYVLSKGYYDAYYLRAQKVRTIIRQEFLKAFEKTDVLIGPTTATPAFKIGEKIEDPLQMYLTDIYTISCNLAGICGISVPCGMAQIQTADGSIKQLPIGLQILGKPFQEATILNVAFAYEQNTPWHTYKSPIAKL